MTANILKATEHIVTTVSIAIHKLLKTIALPAIYLSVAAMLLLLAVGHGHPFGNYTRFGALLIIPALLFCACGIFTSSTLTTVRDDRHQVLLRALICAALIYHTITSISMLRMQGGATIDVYYFQQHSAAALLHGINPYTLTTENIYGRSTAFYDPHMVVDGRVQIGFPYPPASLFFVLPAYPLGDIRYAYVAAVLLSATILVMLRTTLVTAAIACFLLLSPITRYVELQAWTDPFLLLALTCTVYAAVERRWWLPLALGVFLAAKQYGIFAVPFVPFLLEGRRWKVASKLARQAFTVAVLLTVPMVVWDPNRFWRDVVLLHIRQPFRSDALSLANLFFPIPFSVILIFVVIGAMFAIRKARPHPSMFAACYGFVLLIFVCANKQAFCNYYFLIVHSLFLAVATLEIPLSPVAAPDGEPQLAAMSSEKITQGQLLLPISCGIAQDSRAGHLAAVGERGRQ